MFVGTIGRFEPTGAVEIFRSINSVIMGLPGGTIMYPGHDYGSVPSRILEEESKENPFLRGKDLNEFLSLVS